MATHEAFLDATVAKASKAAKALGVKDGMPGRDALALIGSSGFGGVKTYLLYIIG